VKRSGRDETIWVLIHLYMEAVLGISLCSYPYLKLAKTLCHSYYPLIFSLQQNWRKEQNAFFLEGKGVGEQTEGAGGGKRNGPNNVCTYE
jgi:hypothetical protein